MSVFVGVGGGCVEWSGGWVGEYWVSAGPLHSSQTDRISERCSDYGLL